VIIDTFCSEGVSLRSVYCELYCIKRVLMYFNITHTCKYISYKQCVLVLAGCKKLKIDSKQLNALPIQTLHNYLTLFLFSKMEVMSSFPLPFIDVLIQIHIAQTYFLSFFSLIFQNWYICSPNFERLN
jgi:hypothetical protein